MFRSPHNWLGRALIAVVSSLFWLGVTAINLPAQDKAAEKAEQHANEAKAAVKGAEAHAPEAKQAADDVHNAPGADEAGGAPHGAKDAGDAEHHAKISAPLDPKADLALWSLVVFLLFVIILRVAAWGPLRTALTAREHKIKSDIAHAEEARVKAEKMLVDYQTKLAAAQDEVLKTLAEARRDAEHTRQEMMAAAEKEVAATKERAIVEIERTKDAALQELFSHMAGTVAQATERVLGRALTDADQDRLIGDALAEFSRGQAS